MRKPDICICENKDCAADLRFVFAIRVEQSLYYLNPKFQAPGHLLWLYSPVCVGPDRKLRRPVFSQRGSNNFQMAMTETGANSANLTCGHIFGTGFELRHKRHVFS